MIKDSDIEVTVYTDTKRLLGTQKVVRAKFLRTEEMPIDRHFKYYDEAIEFAELKAKHSVRHFIYGGLINDLEEMYALAAREIRSPVTLNKFQEAKERIDKFIRGEE
jgi:hypothetical protein